MPVRRHGIRPADSARRQVHALGGAARSGVAARVCQRMPDQRPPLGVDRRSPQPGRIRRPPPPERRSLCASPVHDLSRAPDEDELMTPKAGAGRRPAEALLQTAWRSVTESVSGRRVESFPYSAPREGVLGPEAIRSGCNICFNSCSTRVYRRGERVTSITGNPDDPVTGGHLCPKSQFLMQMYYSEHRLLHPQRRIGRRGDGKFERVSWDEALDGIAEKLLRVRERYGSEALAVFTGSRSGLLGLDGTAALFCQVWGTANHSGTNPFCGTAPDLAFGMTQGAEAGGSGNILAEDDVWAGDLFIFLGDNMAETRPVNFGQLNERRLRRGARMVVLDPRRTATAQKADE